MRAARSFRGRSQGMTLIEVMVTLTLLGLLSVGLVTTFHLGESTYRQLTRAAWGEHEVVIAQRFLRQILQSAYPFRQRASAREPTFGLEGTSSVLTVTAPMPRGHGAKGNYRYQFLLASVSTGTRNLILRWCLDRNGAIAAGSAGSADDREEVLVSDVETVEWSYLDSPPRSPGLVDVEPEWRSTWLESRKLPAAIRLRITFGAGDHRVWPDLVVVPRVTEDANCEFDVVAQACRET